MLTQEEVLLAVRADMAAWLRELDRLCKRDLTPAERHRELRHLRDGMARSLDALGHLKAQVL